MFAWNITQSNDQIQDMDHSPLLINNQVLPLNLKRKYLPLINIHV